MRFRHRLFGRPAGPFPALARSVASADAVLPYATVSEPKRHIFSGELAETPLPEMLATIHRYKVPGVLEASLGELTKRVFISGGDIIFATSTNRAESLGDMLLAGGRVTMEQYRASSLALLDNPRKRHGQILVEMGVLTEAELRAAVLEQVQRIVWSLFDVGEGHVTFALGEYGADEVYRLRIPTPRAVVYGCKTVGDPKRLMARLGGKTTVFSRPPRPEHLAGFELESAEEQLLEAVDGKHTLFELCERGPYTPGLTARTLYAFHCLGLIRREREAPIKVQVASTPPAN